MTIMRRLAAWRRALAITAIGLGLALAGVGAALLVILDPVAHDATTFLLDEPARQDFSALRWSDAFTHLNAHLAKAYAFGVWKKVDWPALESRYLPRIANAERTNDRRAYYIALREYLWSLHDAHVTVDGSDDGLTKAMIGGGVGLAILRLDDGRTIAHVVLAGGQAAQAGIRWGAEILTWNGVPIRDAVSSASTLWADASPATLDSIRLTEERLITRAPAGTRVGLSFRNPGSNDISTATLNAEDDNFAALTAGDPTSSFSVRDRAIEWSMRPDDIIYIRVRGEIPTLRTPLPLRAIRQAVDAALRAHAIGIVIDVRGNRGGAPEIVPRLMGFFVGARELYEQATMFSDKTGRQEHIDRETFWAEPTEPYFSGPVAMLIDEHCVSACEGLPLIVRRMPQDMVVGFHDTYGSFAFAGASVIMPAGLTVRYPAGQSLDAQGIVQVNSDNTLQGGVAPTIRVPLTWDIAKTQFVDGRDVVLGRAVNEIRARVK